MGKRPKDKDPVGRYFYSVQYQDSQYNQSNQYSLIPKKCSQQCHFPNYKALRSPQIFDYDEYRFFHYNQSDTRTITVPQLEHLPQPEPLSKAHSHVQFCNDRPYMFVYN